MLNVQRMRILREVAGRGTVAAAAEALWVTPPAVSQQLAALSREAGVPLLEREGRRLRLTEAGRRLVAHTERVLAELEAAQADLDAAASGISAHLRISAFPTAARSMIIPALATLRVRHPMLRLSMTDLEPEESMPALKAGRLDLVVTYEWDVLPNIEDPGIEREQLLVEPICLAMPATHACAGRPASVRDFVDEQWVVGRDQTSMLDLVVTSANRAGFEPKTDFHSMDFEIIVAAVGAGLGVALLPPLGLFGRHPDVDFQPLADMNVNRRVYAAIRRGSGDNPALAAVLDALREASESLSCRLDREPGEPRATLPAGG
jgi:DNA-binding transcriptional LysR family regulator